MLANEIYEDYLLRTSGKVFASIMKGIVGPGSDLSIFFA